MNRKKNSIRILAAGMEQFEAKQQQADFSTLETFLSAYLNTPGRKQRKQLAEATLGTASIFEEPSGFADRRNGIAGNDCRRTE